MAKCVNKEWCGIQVAQRKILRITDHFADGQTEQLNAILLIVLKSLEMSWIVSDLSGTEQKLNSILQKQVV